MLMSDLLTVMASAMALPPSAPSLFKLRSTLVRDFYRRTLVRDLLTDIAFESAMMPLVVYVPLPNTSIPQRLLWPRLISFRDLLTDMAGPSAFAASAPKLL